MNKEMTLSKDSLATILICSNLALDSEMDVKPYTTIQWNKLVNKMLHSSFKSPSMFFETTEEDWKQELHLTSEETQRLQILLSRSGQLGIELENLNNIGIQITTRSEGNYPKRLKEILKKNHPPVIFYCGDINIINNNTVSVVGSRNVDEKGLEFTQKLVQKCVSEGFHIVSGGARGVDSIAENTALKEGGKVISFIADSLIQKVKKKEVRQNIIHKNLLLLSDTNPKSGFKIYTAMNRNKYIYALSNYAVVISSDYGKGGTWTGANENLKNNWVPMFVRQEKNIPDGNKKLLEQGIPPLELQEIQKGDLSIGNYFQQKASLISTTKYEQETIDSLLASQPINPKTINMVKEDDNDELQEEDMDLYDVIWPYLKKALKEPRNVQQLCEILNINKSQMQNWMNRSMEENRIEKLKRPVRYQLTENENI